MANINDIIKFFQEDNKSANNRHVYMDEFMYSGYALLDRILPSEHVIDIGCGKNLFKKHLPNLVGIDPATNEADFKVTLQDYQPDRMFDVALCLGSIHGDDQSIRQQILKIKTMLRPGGRIYWRTMPDPAPFVVPYWLSLWTFDRHRDLARDLGFEIVELAWDQRPPPRKPRIYAQWVLS